MLSRAEGQLRADFGVPLEGTQKGPVDPGVTVGGHVVEEVEAFAIVQLVGDQDGLGLGPPLGPEFLAGHAGDAARGSGVENAPFLSGAVDVLGTAVEDEFLPVGIVDDGVGEVAVHGEQPDVAGGVPVDAVVGAHQVSPVEIQIEHDVLVTPAGLRRNLGGVRDVGPGAPAPGDAPPDEVVLLASLPDVPLHRPGWGPCSRLRFGRRQWMPSSDSP